MRAQAIGDWLDELASSQPAPGGGAAAALELAIAAALVEMVCNLTLGKPAFAEHEPLLLEARERATALRAEALGLAAADADAFLAVIEAYRLPRGEEDERARRAERIEAALAAAAAVPRRTAAAASELLELAEGMLGRSNPNVVSDVAAAAAAARAALSTALVNVEINRASIEDAALRDELAGAADAITSALVRAEVIVAAVREQLGS